MLKDKNRNHLFSSYPPAIVKMEDKFYTIDDFFGWSEIEPSTTVDDLIKIWIKPSDQLLEANRFKMVIDKIVFEDEIFVIIKNDNNYTCTCGSKDCNHKK